MRALLFVMGSLALLACGIDSSIHVLNVAISHADEPIPCGRVYCVDPLGRCGIDKSTADKGAIRQHDRRGARRPFDLVNERQTLRRLVHLPPRLYALESFRERHLTQNVSL